MDVSKHELTTGLSVVVVGIMAFTCMCICCFAIFLYKGYSLSRRTGIKWISMIPMVIKSKHILKYIEGKSKDYGPVLMQYFGAGNHVIVCDTRSIQYILKHDDEFFKVKMPTSPSISERCGESIVITNGDKYKFHKQALSPFLKEQTLRGFNNKFVNVANTLVDKISDMGADGSKNEYINVGIWMTRLTLDVLGSTLFGVDMGTLTGKVNELPVAINVFMREITNPIRMVYPGFDKYTYLQSNIDTIKSINDLSNYINCIIEKKKQGNKRTEDFDLFDCLLDMTDEKITNNITNENTTNDSESRRLNPKDLFSNIMVMMTAGHETTATALTWACHFLSVYPEIQQALYEEVKNKDVNDFDVVSDSGPTLLNRVIKETLRLMPPVGLIPGRKCSKDVEIPIISPITGNNYIIPAGSFVSYSIWCVHRNPEDWPEPDKFDPERFQPHMVATRNPATYLPFSSGRRPCIGQNFSLVEQRIVLILLLQKFRLLPYHGLDSNKQPEIRGGIFTTPVCVRVKFEPR